MLACVDESGTLQVELLEEMMAYGAGDDDDVVEGDFAPGIIEKADLTITLEVFRYCPQAGESGWDTLTCAVPGHATVQDLLITMQRDLDGSLAFRRGGAAGTPTTGVRVNGRIVLADCAQIGDLTQDGGRVRIEPLPGHPVVRTLWLTPPATKATAAVLSLGCAPILVRVNTSPPVKRWEPWTLPPLRRCTKPAT